MRTLSSVTEYRFIDRFEGKQKKMKNNGDRLFFTRVEIFSIEIESTGEQRGQKLFTEIVLQELFLVVVDGTREPGVFVIAIGRALIVHRMG